MTKGVFNWTYKDVVKFLRRNGFSYDHTEGSHYFYIKKGEQGKDFSVCIPFHASKSLKPKVLTSIISQSGIERRKWLNR